MIQIVVDEINERLSYTFDFIFKSRGVEYALTTNRENEQFETTFVYSQKPFGNAILSSSLLYSKKIENYTISKNNFGEEECLSFDGVTDPIATIFYILTRYEEYTSNVRDAHGRFPFSESVLSKYNWVEKAICDRLAIEILKFIGLDFKKETKVQIIPTFDIDNTFAYQLKSGKQKFLSICKDIAQLNFSRLRERKSVKNGAKDPYDTFDKIKSVAKLFPKTKLFWLVGELAEKDRNISIFNEKHRALIQEMNTICSVNLHPSYASFLKKEKLQEEKENLEKIIETPIYSSRQHFLRFQLPNSFQILEELGFEHEYSMGFAENVGFRCGTARAHSWFDVKQNRVRDLVIHPFMYMDGTLNEYMQLSIDESKNKIQELYNEVKEFGGDFVFLWHNETIGDYQKWKGWSEVLDFTLNLGDE